MSILDKFKSGLSMTGFRVKQHSPEILVATGLVGVVAGTLLACKATTKFQETIKEEKTRLEEMKAYVEDSGFTEKYSKEDYFKDQGITYFQGGLKVLKLYAPALIVGGLGIAAIISSHRVLRTRNAALAAAYTALGTNFKNYRNRVVDRFGKELDNELRYNLKTKEVTSVETDENDEEKIVSTTVDNVVDPNLYDCSVYAKFFDEACSGWTKDPNYNLTFLKQQQNYANDVLKSKGFLFLNDVYKMLDIPETKIGRNVGWIYNEKNPKGDNFVDFGIYNVNRERNRAFVNGYERSILLDFNVDGEIYHILS